MGPQDEGGGVRPSGVAGRALARQRGPLPHPRTAAPAAGGNPGRTRAVLRAAGATGLRISEAIALRWKDIELDRGQPRVRVRRAIVKGVLGAPKSRHVRTVPISNDLTARLRAVKPAQADPDDLAFPNDHGRPLNTNNLRNRILAPARESQGQPQPSLRIPGPNRRPRLLRNRRSGVRISPGALEWP
jgi:integrase